MKKIIVTLLAILTLSTTVLAGTTLPNSVKEYKEGNNVYIVKKYEVDSNSVNEFERNIENSFKDGLKVYKLDNTSKSGGNVVTSKEETQVKIVETDSEKIEDVLPLFPSEIEYEEDDEYTGSLLLDTSSIVTTKISDGSYYKRYSIHEEVEYRNYSKNDMDSIPKTRVKDGVNMHLVSVDWKVQNTEMIGSSQVPVSYIAIAYYEGIGTQKVVGQAKYTSSAIYTGIVEKEEIKPFEYELSYIKVADYTVLMAISVLLFIIGIVLILVGVIHDISIKRKRK